jgi:chromosome partitioning protein
LMVIIFDWRSRGAYRVQVDVSRMLDWFKRITTPAPSAKSPSTESHTAVIGAQVEGLVERLDRAKWSPLIHANSWDASSLQAIGACCKPADELQTASARTRVIVITSQKGGTGKTTIAAHLAVEAGMAGDGPVVLLDTDPQGSLSEWWDARDSEQVRLGEGPAVAATRVDDLAAKLAEVRNGGTAVAIVDTAPAHTTSIERTIAMADLVLIPARPSPHDLRAIGATVNMTRSAGKPYFFVINGAAPRANITAEAIAALSEHGRVAPVILYQRTDYASSMIDGRTVMEMGTQGRSAAEVAKLWKFLHAQINLPAVA